MTPFVKSIGIILMSVVLFGLTSGCGKKLVRDSSALDSKVASVSTKPSLADLEEVQVTQEIDLKVGESESGNQTERQGSILRGITTPVVGEPVAGLNNDLGNQATLAMPGQKMNPVLGRGSNQKGVTFSNGLQDIYFEFDSWRLTEKSRRVLESNAEWLKAHPHERLTIEGHCDERGTQAYNYVLGEKRATMVKQYLSFLGVSHSKLLVTSFGKDKPKCHTYSENCFQQNRRAHFDSDLNLASK